MAGEKEVLTVEEAADFLRAHPSTLYRLLSEAHRARNAFPDISCREPGEVPCQADRGSPQ